MLEKIEKPQDLKKLNKEELKKLPDEIRKVIIDVTKEKGGHLAGSLGVVELTIALHYVFDSPKDKILWDVGHQAYAHKLLTGRYKNFHTLRTLNGISGFPHPEESEHDSFIAGHASNAISAALGIATARDLNGKNFKVIAVVGDGSLTGGMAYEGLNHAGHIQKDIIIILNDNQMFISKRVGALGTYLAKIFTLGLVKEIEKGVERTLSRIKFWGPKLLRLAKRIKVLLFPGMIFEEMGFAYFGPVDGHNLFKLIEILNGIKKLSGPILLHIITKKGKGYPPAEKTPEKFHGIGKKEGLTYTKVFSETLIELAKKDNRICAITAAMPEGTGLIEFQKHFPDRFFDVGIAEQHAVTFSAGLAKQGLKPVCAIYSTFLQRAFDQIIHDVCILKLPVIFAIDRAGIVGEDGVTHQGIFDLSYLRLIPNIVVCAPKDGIELRNLLYSSFKYKKPVAIRYPRGKVDGIYEKKDFEFIPEGKGEIIEEGEDIALVGIGNTVYKIVNTGKKLKKEGFNPCIINMRFVKPLDKEILEKLKNFKIIFTFEENTLKGGFGSAIREELQNFNGRIINFGLPDKFIEHGESNELRKIYGLSEEKIYENVRRYL
ncbi:MAG: 1-deoxy-D-xylulose-5-phosphate synthase [Caldiserica bacterium]|nr:MAG: 1-deoxy-D-xylulose-5-phosphate synthase [Caldisericota bacterium]